jgi:hypothetical protein
MLMRKLTSKGDPSNEQAKEVSTAAFRRITSPVKMNNSYKEPYTDDGKTGEATHTLSKDEDSEKDADIGLTEDAFKQNINTKCASTAFEEHLGVLGSDHDISARRNGTSEAQFAKNLVTPTPLYVLGLPQQGKVAEATARNKGEANKYANLQL